MMPKVLLAVTMDRAQVYKASGHMLYIAGKNFAQNFINCLIP
jgi:hypothetical protein